MLMSEVWMTGHPASMQLADSGGQTPMIVEIAYEQIDSGRDDAK